MEPRFEPMGSALTICRISDGDTVSQRGQTGDDK